MKWNVLICIQLTFLRTKQKINKIIKFIWFKLHDYYRVILCLYIFYKFANKAFPHTILEYNEYSFRWLLRDNNKIPETNQLISIWKVVGVFESFLRGFNFLRFATASFKWNEICMHPFLYKKAMTWRLVGNSCG